VLASCFPPGGHSISNDDDLQMVGYRLRAVAYRHVAGIEMRDNQRCDDGRKYRRVSQWSTYGVTSEGYVHVFLWEAQNSFSYLTTDEITADFLKWVHVNGQFATKFSPVARYHDVDYTTFRDDKQQRACAGFRRTGNERRGGYDWIMGGILCAPAGKNLTQDQFFRFVDNVRLQGEPTPAGLRRAPGSF